MTYPPPQQPSSPGTPETRLPLAQQEQTTPAQYPPYGGGQPYPGSAPASPPAGYSAPQYPPPPPYSQATPYPSAGTGAPQPTNGMALASLILGIAGFFLPIIASIAAVITGHIALSQIKQRPQRGGGMAVAGLILGYACIALGILLFFLFLVILAGTVGWMSTVR